MRTFQSFTLAAASATAVLLACPTAEVKPPTGPPPSSDTAEMSAKIRALENRVRRGEAAKAREELVAQVTAHPQDLTAHFLLAWVGAPSEEAWQQLHRLSNEAPKDPWCHYGMARIYSGWKMFDQAQKELDHLFALSPQFVPGLVAKGTLLREQGSLEASKQAFEAALKLIPTDVDALAGLGITLLRIGDEAAGRASLEKALAGDADCFQVVNALAAGAAKGTDLEVAIKLQTKLAELAPSDRGVRLALAALFEKQGDLKAAAAGYEAAQKLVADAAVARSLAALYNKLADKEGEIRALEALVRIEATDAEAHIRLAELKSDDAQAVDQHLKAASAIAANNPELRVRLAALLEKQGDYVAALENYRAAGKAKDGAGAAAMKALEGKLELSPLSGDANRVSSQISSKLTKLFKERSKTEGKLSGKYKILVTVDETGTTKNVEVVEDTVHDPILLGHIYFQLKDARFPKRKMSPLFEFEVHD